MCKQIGNWDLVIDLYKKGLILKEIAIKSKVHMSTCSILTCYYSRYGDNWKQKYQTSQRRIAKKLWKKLKNNSQVYKKYLAEKHLRNLNYSPTIEQIEKRRLLDRKYYHKKMKLIRKDPQKYADYKLKESLKASLKRQRMSKELKAEYNLRANLKRKLDGDRIRQRVRDYNKRNRDEIRHRNNAYYHINKDKINAYQRLRRKSNIDKARQWAKDWYQKNKDKVCYEAKIKYQQNKDKMRQQANIRYYKRKMLLKNS